MKLEQLQARAFRIITAREANARQAQARDAELEKELAAVLAQLADMEKDDRSSKSR